MIIGGIDPGKKGALVVYTTTTKRMQKFVMPLNKQGNIDLKALCTLINKYFKKATVFLEKIHSIKGTGKQSMFTMGRGLGQLESALVCNGIDFHWVRPYDWQKAVWVPKDVIKKRSDSGKTMVNDTKASSMNAFKRIFPKTDVRYGDLESKKYKRTVHKDGIVDAALIAYYGYLKLKK